MFSFYDDIFVRKELDLVIKRVLRGFGTNLEGRSSLNFKCPWKVRSIVRVDFATLWLHSTDRHHYAQFASRTSVAYGFLRKVAPFTQRRSLRWHTCKSNSIKLTDETKNECTMNSDLCCATAFSKDFPEISEGSVGLRGTNMSLNGSCPDPALQLKRDWPLVCYSL